MLRQFVDRTLGVHAARHELTEHIALDPLHRSVDPLPRFIRPGLDLAEDFVEAFRRHLLARPDKVGYHLLDIQCNPRGWPPAAVLALLWFRNTVSPNDALTLSIAAAGFPHHLIFLRRHSWARKLGEGFWKIDVGPTGRPPSSPGPPLKYYATVEPDNPRFRAVTLFALPDHFRLHAHRPRALVCHGPLLHVPALVRGGSRHQNQEDRQRRRPNEPPGPSNDPPFRA